VRLVRPLLLALALASPLAVVAQSTPDAAAIVAVMDKSVADWNRGDIDAFATSYKDAPDILFIGRSISRGYAQMVATYKHSYSGREQMGTLSFSQLEVQPLDAHFATVTGHFHLERTAAGGGNANGYFLLVFEKTSAGWKIVRDDTTALPAATEK
jgi:ketosteroid isomerase-like protein